MASKENRSTSLTYHCYDCGGIWDESGVDIYQNKDVTKYICKECRGRCIPKHELGKVVGVKSIKQRYSKSRILLYFAIILLFYFSFQFYQQRVTIADYRNYLAETAKIRKDIGPHLLTYRDDYKIIEKSKKEKIDPQRLRNAKIKFLNAQRYIQSKSDEIESIQRPDKKEIIELYDIETGFWRDPSYKNYLTYTAVFNNLERKYGNDFFSFIKDKVRDQITHKKSKK